MKCDITSTRQQWSISNDFQYKDVLGGLLSDEETVEINTLQDLLDIIELTNHPIILSNHGTPCIEIYDDYRE